MKIYNNDIIRGIYNFILIFLYKFSQQTYPIWYNLFVFIIRKILIYFIKIFYLSTNTINLYDVVISVNSIIIYSGRLNLTNYNIVFYYDRHKINIIGNDNFILINNYFHRLIKDQNKYYSLCYSNHQFTIYLKPLKIYSQEECCICYSEFGSLIGLCGHQNVCTQCQSRIYKCPVCNDSNILIHNNNLIKI